jgi:hypothetical protein
LSRLPVLLGVLLLLNRYNRGLVERKIIEPIFS